MLTSHKFEHVEVQTSERIQTGRQGLSSVEGWELPCRIQHACEINYEF